MEALRENFKPEFLNRLDETVIFHSLGKEVLSRIVDLQLAEVGSRLAERGISITISEEAKRLLTEKGYDPAYGARPLRRTIQTLILDPLALKIISGEIINGSRLTISVKNDSIVLEL